MEATLLQYGLAGVCIMALGLAVKRLFELLTASNEARLTDAVKFANALNDAVNGQRDAIRLLTEAVKNGAANGK